MARFMLHVKATLFRALQSILTLFDLYLSRPLPRRASFTHRIIATIGSSPGCINLFFYTPASYTTSNPTNPSTAVPKRHPLLINFHGGGFTIGNANDDARWATAITTYTSALVVSVAYRRAPEHPFPTGTEDCVSAVLWLWKHADEHNLDISRTAFSGFSAGGNLCYAVAIRLHEELTRLGKEGKLGEFGGGKGRLVSLAVFYGSVDWTQTRAERDASNPDLIPSIPHAAFRLFDEGYLPLGQDMTSPLLSPGIAPDKLLKAALPESLVLINCGGDQLLAEGERFRERLKGLGKKVDGYVVEGVGHAWDKIPSFGKGNVKRDEAYKVAVESLQEAWA